MEIWVGSPKLSPLAQPPLCSTKFPWKKTDVASSLLPSWRGGTRSHQPLVTHRWASWPWLGWSVGHSHGQALLATATTLQALGQSTRRWSCSSRRWECRKKGHEIQWDWEHDPSSLQEVPHSPQPHHPRGRGTFPPKDPPKSCSAGPEHHLAL